MPTTKVRAKTPMKNKPAFWRRTAKKIIGEDGSIVRIGRRLRNMSEAQRSFKAGIQPIHIWLFRSAGISTPVFDKQFAERNNVSLNSATEPVDVEATIPTTPLTVGA